MLAVPAHEGLRSARLGGTSSLGYRRAPGACRPVVNGWFGQVAIAGRGPRSGASRRSASLSRPCALQQGWRRSVVWVSSEQPKRAAVAQLRQASLPVLRHVHWKHCRAARLPSSQPRARPPSRTSSSRAPCRRQVLGAIRGQKTGIFEKRLRVRRAHPWATPPCKRLILGALRGSVGAIHQYLWNGGSFAEFAEGGEPTNES